MFYLCSFLSCHFTLYMYLLNIYIYASSSVLSHDIYGHGSRFRATSCLFL